MYISELFIEATFWCQTD